MAVAFFEKSERECEKIRKRVFTNYKKWDIIQRKAQYGVDVDHAILAYCLCHTENHGVSPRLAIIF